MSLTYLFDLVKDDNETYHATCPAFPEVNTFVEDIGELLAIGADAIDTAIAARIADGEDIPPEATQAEIDTCYISEDGDTARAWVKLQHQTTLKVLLYTLLRSEGLCRAGLASLLKWKPDQVDRLFGFDDSARMKDYEAVFRALNQDLRITLAPRPPFPAG